MAMFNPPHPGEVIRAEIIEAHRLTVTAAAKVLGVSRQALSALLNAQADLTGDMALRLGKRGVGPGMETLHGVRRVRREHLPDGDQNQGKRDDQGSAVPAE